MRRLTMTAALALYDDLIAYDNTLLESTVEELGDEALLSLLLLRFRSFLSCGFGEPEALLLAVGYTHPDVAFLLDAARSASPVLH
jgi:hypothetical protein